MINENPQLIIPTM